MGRSRLAVVSGESTGWSHRSCQGHLVGISRNGQRRRQLLVQVLVHSAGEVLAERTTSLCS